jgi:hypothetical protein
MKCKIEPLKCRVKRMKHVHHVSEFIDALERNPEMTYWEVGVEWSDTLFLGKSAVHDTPIRQAIFRFGELLGYGSALMEASHTEGFAGLLMPYLRVEFAAALAAEESAPHRWWRWWLRLWPWATKL